jgi:hypothetical protein
MEGRRSRTQRGSHVGDLRLGDAQIERVFDDQRGRSRRDGGRRVDVSIGPGADDARERRSRSHEMAVVDDIRHVDTRVAAVGDDLDVGQELSELHALVPHPFRRLEARRFRLMDGAS